MAKKKQKRGGVIPYYIEEDGTIEMLFMKPSDAKYGGAQFQIAKGKIEDDESDEDGAFREAQEELGLFEPNTRNRINLGTFLGRTAFFVAEVIDKDKFGDTTFETAATKWMTPEEFQKEGRALHRSVVKAAVRSIEKRL